MGGVEVSEGGEARGRGGGSGGRGEWREWMKL